MRAARFCALATGLCLVVSAAVTPGEAGAQVELKELLTGRYPLTLKLKDLSSDWRRLSVSGQFDMGMGGYMQAFSSMFGGSAGSVYYTRGEMVVLGAETYVIAYRPRLKTPDLSSLMTSSPNSKPPVPEALTPETPLAFSLLNLRTSGSLVDIQEFDLKRETGAEAGSKTAAAPPSGSDAEQSVANLRQITLGLLMYAQDYNETLPTLDGAEAIRKALQPYVKNASAFLQPGSQKPYRSNVALSRKKLAQVSATSETVVFYEAEPAADGTRAVAYLDGHVKRIPEARWPALKRLSKIP